MGRKTIANIDKKIVREVWRESVKYGIESVSTKEISQKLKISEPVIFTHFKTKKNLMLSAFEEAWRLLPDRNVIPTKLINGDEEEAFSNFKEIVRLCTANPSPIIYANQFVNSSYFSKKEAGPIMSSYEQELKRNFGSINPKITPNYLENLSDLAISGLLNSLSRIVLGQFGKDDESLCVVWGTIVYGFVGVLKMEGAAAPKLIRQDF
jgi:AcrR family transcriptional regulator